MDLKVLVDSAYVIDYLLGHLYEDGGHDMEESNPTKGKSFISLQESYMKFLLLPLILLMIGCPQSTSNTYTTTIQTDGYTCKRIINPLGEVVQEDCFYPTSPNEIDYN